MDSGEEEDVSARVLLRNVLHTETQRSPVTRRMSRDQSHIRRSSRLRNMPAETPHVALRHKLKQKLRETATRSPLPPSKRARSQSGLPKTPVVRLSPALYDDDDVTPRGLLRGIIQTEAEASLLLSGQTALPHRDQQDVETGNRANRRSDGASGLELPDLATEPLTQVIRGMSRRRPPPTFNISAFEKQLDQPSGEDEEMDVPLENPDVSKEQDLSGSKSVLSLTLKTPFVNLQTHRAGLRRKAAGRRRQVSVDAFDEAIQKRLERRHNQDYTVVQDGRTLQDSDLHKLTLGLSNTTVPELTTDTMMSNTELYAQPQTSVSELRDAEGGVTDAEMKRGDDDDDGREIQDVAQDQQTLSERNISKAHPDPSEDPEADSESQEEEGEVETIPQSQESDAVSLNPEDIQLAPMEDVVDHVSQPQEQEQSESAIQDAQVEEMDQREGESLQEEDEPSHPPERIVRRAYRSEGRAITNGAMERGRGTKSLGMNPDPTEKHLQTLAEEPHRRPASSSAVHTTKPSSSVTHQDSLVQNPDEDDEVIQDLHQSGSEEIVVSVHVSPMVDFPAAEEEEEEEEEQEQQQQEEEEEKKEQEHEQQEEEEEEEEEEQEHEQQEEEEEEEEEEQERQEEEEQEEEVQEHQQQEEEEQEEEMEEQVQEQPQEEEEEHDDAQSEELSMQTPGFIRQRKQVATPGALATPTILKALNAGPAPKVVKSRPKRQPQHVSTRVLPKSYVMSVFKHFAKTKVSSDVYPVINDILQRYFDRLAEDLEAYSAHAKRKTIEVEDVELLMRRQGFVTDSTPVTVLIEKFLPLEYRKLLIPVATSGNNVVPHQRR
ncbi:hypothetical protein AMELA_G00131440 [Ameiurus melas]|uniref:CENP-T/Histone H4 histone fold domain-containing protein n=1 Tax=Ameiurus melas TaxID=219545 RepID=A0A7J6AIL8_AMEME|nr:hypothetical protein AMELA_G00131440 [Ameiurus melas]